MPAIEFAAYVKSMPPRARIPCENVKVRLKNARATLHRQAVGQDK
jgi:hypothetical protein